MSDHSAIEWTEATWNPVRGCTKVSPGCAHCYAETFAERFRGVPGHAYEQGFDLRLVPEKLGEPQHWKKPRRVFVNSMSDLFQDGVPDDYIAEVWKTMATIQRHTYQVLTKRPERMRAILPRLVATFGVLPNVWLGVSVENQTFAPRIWELLKTPAAIRFVSLEPLLGPVDLDAIEALCKTWRRGYTIGTYLDWVIVGGESGTGARPFDLAWARSIVQQCKAAGVACFVKQVGAVPTMSCGQCGRTIGQVMSGWTDSCGPTHAALIAESQRIRDRKGGDPAEWPEDLRVREFPSAVEAIA